MKRIRYQNAQDKIQASMTISSTGCWEWSRGCRSDGYGWLKWKGEIWYAHRLSYVTYKGVIPENYELDHLCRNRKCINPEHLEAVTSKENVLRGEGACAKNSRKVYCKYGHLLDGIYTRPDNGTAMRTCSVCYELKKKKAKEKRLLGGAKSRNRT